MSIIEDLKILNMSGYKDGIFNKMLIDGFHELILKLKEFSDQLVHKVIEHNLIKEIMV